MEVNALAHGYRSLQHFNQWLAQQSIGLNLLSAEQQILTKMLKKHMGKHVLLIGVPQQIQLFNTTSIPCHTLLSPLQHHAKNYHFIESNFHELPVYTGSIDLVILPHILEFVDNPRQLIGEACRVVKPEGLLIVCGFNPMSAWGMNKAMTVKKTAPWTGSFYNSKKVQKWLQLADFVIEQQQHTLYRPPMTNASLYQKLKFMEWMGHYFFRPFGGVYILLSRAKVTPLTPIRMQWKQAISGFRISTSITGHIARASK